jgi:hydrogenase/urease accessory protein HupE
MDAADAHCDKLALNFSMHSCRQMLAALRQPGYGFLFILLLLLPLQLHGHKLKPSVIDVTFLDSGQFNLEMDLNLEAAVAGIGPRHQETGDSPQADFYDSLRALPPEALEARFRQQQATFNEGLSALFDDRRATIALDAVTIPAVGDTRLARRSKLSFAGAVPEDARAFSLKLDPEYGNVVLRIRIPEQDGQVTHWLTYGKASPPYLLRQEVLEQAFWPTAWQYTKLGFTHILPLGVDHILFVLGLFLLSIRLKPLLWQVTAFTLAHTITLALSILGYIDLPDTVVEPLIAASIVYIGVENILTKEMHWHRVFVIFVFGLLHGMGFAGVLHELGLPENQLATALISFNVGVELGQIAVILLAFLALGLWFRNRSWYRQLVVIPLSLLIALVGLYWFVERVS